MTASLNRLDSPARLAALRTSELMDSPPEAAFDRLTKLAVLLLNTPVALVSLVDERRQFFKSQVGLIEPWATMRETPLTHSFCQHVVTSGEPLIIDNALQSDLVKDNLAIRDIGVMAYAGVPLFDAGGESFGSFCAIDTKPRTWTQTELEVLETLAAIAMTEMQLRHTLQALHRTAEIKDQLIGLVSHELRTPLAGILGTLRVMEMDVDPQADNTMLDMALRSGERLLRLTNDLLSIEQIETGKFPVNPVHAEASRLLQDSSEAMRDAAAEQGITLLVQPTHDHVLADPDRIAQVLNNLIGNAIKFSPRGSAITLSATRESEGVRFEVRDEGRGIPADKIEMVFERFAQVESGDKHEKGGAGLGLAICRAIVLQHGGRIWAESELGNGTSMQFVLPSA